MSPVAKSSIKFGIIALVVLVIAGAFLIPMFNRNRITPRQNPLIQDGRILGNSAQQYFLTTGQKTVTFTYDSATGKISGPLEPWVTTIDKGYTIPDTTIEEGNPAAFTLSQPSFRNGQPVIFSDEGKTTTDPNR